MTSAKRFGFIRRLSLAVTGAALIAACQGPATFVAGDPASEDRAKDLSLKHVRETAPSLLAGVGSVDAHRVKIDDQGRPHTWLTQKVGGVPVFGGAAIVHLKRDGAFEYFTDDLVRVSNKVDTRADLSATEAIERAVATHGGWSATTGTPTAALQILDHNGKGTLTYQVTIEQFEAGSDPAVPVVFIDADTGDVVWEYDSLPHSSLDTPDPVSGVARQTFDYHNAKADTVRQLNTGYANADIADSSDPDANAAHTHVGDALAYFFNQHGRSSFNETGALVRSYVHVGRNYNNAFWYNDRLHFGDGDGSVFSPLVSRDIAGHELAHGVTENEADLIYANESGALNEATSDIFAAAIEHAQGATALEVIYWVGEDTWTPGTAGDAMRYMNDPTAAGDYDFYPTRYVGTSDNGGVHSNSGIANLWFYLISETEGSQHQHPRAGTITANGTIPSHFVTAIGMQNAADVWYRALAFEMTASSDFGDARGATVNAAIALNHGPGDADNWVPSIEAAWDAVGVAAPPPPIDYQPIVTDPMYQTSYSGAAGTEFEVMTFDSNGYDAMKFELSGGGTNDDADLYVRLDSAPTSGPNSAWDQGTWDCGSFTPGSNEVCEFNPTTPGTYYVFIYAYSAITNVQFAASGSSSGPCVPATTCAAGADCGTIDDGCGGTIVCGSDTCAVGTDTCGGGGEANVCGCTADTCESLGLDCGDVSAGDSCGGTLDCGNLDCGGSATDSCGGGGADNVCGCTATTTCTTEAAECGTITDDCGDSASCGSCASGFNCESNVCVEAPPAACAGGGTSEVGCSCVDNNECASNKCKGKPNGKTCK